MIPSWHCMAGPLNTTRSNVVNRNIPRKPLDVNPTKISKQKKKAARQSETSEPRGSENSINSIEEVKNVLKVALSLSSSSPLLCLLCKVLSVAVLSSRSSLLNKIDSLRRRRLCEHDLPYHSPSGRKGQSTNSSLLSSAQKTSPTPTNTY